MKKQTVTKPKIDAKYAAATAERRLARLDRGLTEAIEGVLAQKGWTRQLLGKKTGIAHSTLSYIMAGTCGGRSWNLNQLMRIAVALGVKLSDIILAAETVDDVSVALLAVAGTDPATKERLTKLIQCVAPAGTAQEVLDLFYTSAMMEAVASRYVEGYLVGRISDHEVFNTLSEVQSSLESGENLWGKFAAVLAESEGPSTT